MRIRKGTLKRIIREEYRRLVRQGLIFESASREEKEGEYSIRKVQQGYKELKADHKKRGISKANRDAEERVGNAILQYLSKNNNKYAKMHPFDVLDDIQNAGRLKLKDGGSLHDKLNKLGRGYANYEAVANAIFEFGGMK